MYQDSFVGPDYFKVMGIGIVKGREFRQDDRRGGPVVVAVNEEFVRRYLSGAEPIGAQLRLPGPTEAGYLAEVVAVVRNGKYRSLGESQQAAIYEVYGQRVNQHRFAHIFVRSRPGAAPPSREIARAAAGARSLGGDRGAADAHGARLCVPAQPGRVPACSAPWARSA